MTDKKTLLELAERVERGEAHRHEIARVAGWHRVEPRFTPGKRGFWISPDEFLGTYSDGSPRMDGMNGTTCHRDTPDYLNSLDAAKALHDAVLPGWEWSVSSETNINDGFAEVEVYTEKDKHLDVFASSGKTANPAAAWVAAILRAKAEESET